MQEASLDQLVGEGLTPEIRDVNPKISKNIDGVRARWLTGESADAGGPHPNIRPIRHHLAE